MPAPAIGVICKGYGFKAEHILPGVNRSPLHDEGIEPAAKRVYVVYSLMSRRHRARERGLGQVCSLQSCALRDLMSVYALGRFFFLENRADSL
jgi:hypothetical protein